MDIGSRKAFFGESRFIPGYSEYSLVDNRLRGGSSKDTTGREATGNDGNIKPRVSIAGYSEDLGNSNPTEEILARAEERADMGGHAFGEEVKE